MIVLVLTAEEGARITTLLPAGPLRDEIAGKVAMDRVCNAPASSFLCAMPNRELQTEIFDDELADAMWAAMHAVLDRRGCHNPGPAYLSVTGSEPCPRCGSREYVTAIRNALGHPLWFRCSACDQFGWNAPDWKPTV